MHDTTIATAPTLRFSPHVDAVELRCEPMRGGTVAWLTLPAPDVFYWPVPLGRRTRCPALIRTERATLHLLTLYGVAWTTTRKV